MAEIKQLKYFANGEWKTSKTEKYMDVYTLGVLQSIQSIGQHRE